MSFHPLREVPARAGWGPGDVLVLFGELFGRGYANGIVEEARRAGMAVVGATVGRRDPGGPLRALTPEELAAAEANLGGRIVNVPMEAGFDLEPAGDGASPVDQLKGARADAWREVALDWDLVARSREAGALRFEKNLVSFAAEVERLVPPGANLLFVHTMAGGFPRARVYMPLMTRIFRGTGERYLPSDAFWASDLGRLWDASFEEVTARTFGRLVAATARLRQPGRRVRYVAYGYHGCEVATGGALRWQTYVPYMQGWAKMLLERLSAEAWAEGVRCTVFNAPEIWTNSSALFLGVEVSLYPLLRALREHGGQGTAAEEVWDACRALLRQGATPEGLLARADEYLGAPSLERFRRIDGWPQHSAPEQVEAMLAASEACMAMSADPRNPACEALSRPVFQAVGRIMFHASWEPRAPVEWVGHDVVAKVVTGGV
ncbi:MAG TPA: hypothetical protein VFP65_12545 [Anaeromyxobacteraceae bacterium]|nr:hypothetical protein [Anaeromyxobacteraceae bacterium]